MDDDVARSRPGLEAGHVAPQPQEVAVALEAQRGDHRGQGLVPRIDPVAAQEEMDVRQTALESGGGAEEVRVVLERVVPRDEPDERGVRGEAEVLAHVAPGCGVGAENVGVEAVGDDCQPLRREAPPRVRLPDRFGAANDPGGEPPGQPGHAETVIRVVPLVSRGMWLA